MRKHFDQMTTIHGEDLSKGLLNSRISNLGLVLGRVLCPVGIPVNNK